MIRNSQALFENDRSTLDVFVLYNTREQEICVNEVQIKLQCDFKM
jgi:hypothetical protein